MEGYARRYVEDPYLWFLACDEISGIFIAYRKVNPVPYHEMKVKSIKSRLKEKAFLSTSMRKTRCGRHQYRRIRFPHFCDP